jgi:hypothetical protein
MEVGHTGEVEYCVDDRIDGDGVRRQLGGSLGWSAVMEGVPACTGPAAAAFQDVFIVSVEERVEAKD